MTSIEIDSAWMSEHSLELEAKYGGKWIAVHDRQVIGVGDTAVEANAEARKICPQGGFVLEAVEAHTDTLYASIRLA